MLFRKPFLPRPENPPALINRIYKVIQDFVISFSFSFFILYGLYCIMPQISRWMSLSSLLSYTILFTLGWNLLFSNTLTIVLSISVLFLSGITGSIVIFLNKNVLSQVNGYFRWLASLLLASGDTYDSYAKLTAILLTVFCCFLSTFLVSRTSGNLPILLIILAVSAIFDLYGTVFLPGLLMLFLFAISWHYIRLRHTVYLDLRLFQIDTPSYGKIPFSLTFPACILVLITIAIVFSLPEGLFLANTSIRNAGRTVSSFIIKSENDFFKSRKSVDYDVLPVGYDDNMGPLFDQSDVVTLKVTGYSENADYIYLRSHASSVYEDGWLASQLSPIAATDPVSPFTMGQNELRLAQELLRYRALISEDPSCREYSVLRLMQTSDINVTYGDIKTSWVFELPMATSYSAFEGVSLRVADDLGGCGLFSSQMLPQNTSYTVTYLAPVKSDKTVDLYRYFGKGFYQSLSEDEISQVYGDRWEGYSVRAETIQSTFADPATVPSALFTLGKRLVASSETTLDQALDIAEYLLNRYTYDPEILLTDRQGDFVTDFLFCTYKGGEIHFASSAVLLLRSVGIPARYCEGYLTFAGGESGEVSIRQCDAHAWAEFYLEGLGWIPLEVTPTRGTPATDLRSPSYQDPSREISFLATLSRDDLLKGITVLFQTILTGVLHLFVLVLSVSLLFFILAQIRRLVLLLSSGMSGVNLSFRYLRILLRVAGYPRPKGEGLLTYSQRIDKLLPEHLSLSQATAALYAHIYGGETLDLSSFKEVKRWILHFPANAQALHISRWRRFLMLFI